MSVLLLDGGASVNATAANGRTALHEAAAHSRLSGAFVLCRYGADPAATDADGRTPYDLARGIAPSEPQPEGDDGLSQWLEPGGGCAIVAAAARAAHAPVTEDEARAVFQEAVKK